MPYHLWLSVVFVVLFILDIIVSIAHSSFEASDEKKIEKLSEGGNKKAEKLLDIIRGRRKKLTVLAKICDYFLFILLVMISYEIVGELRRGNFGNYILMIPIVVASFSLITIFFGKFIPSFVSTRHPERTAMKVCTLANALCVVFFPVIFIVAGASELFYKVFGVKPEGENEAVTEEEILQMVDAGEEDGSIESKEKEMIENIFEFNNTTASDVMVHRTEITAIDATEDEQEILKLIEDTGYSRFPVYKENIDNIIGILSTRVFLLNQCSSNKKPLSELVYAPYFVPESVITDDLFRNMQANKSHMAIVLDEYGGTSGLVTMEDLLEQIVGNIYDETDDKTDEVHDIEKISDNIWRIQGTAVLDEIEEELGVDFPPEDDDLSTLTGLIFSRFVTIPADGETPEITIGRLHIAVECITDHRVDSAIVELLPISDEEESDLIEEK